MCLTAVVLELLGDLTPFAAFGALGLSVWTFFDRKKDPAREAQRVVRSEVRTLLAEVEADLDELVKGVEDHPKGIYKTQQYGPRIAALANRTSDSRLEMEIHRLRQKLDTVFVAATGVYMAANSIGKKNPEVDVPVAITELRQETAGCKEQLKRLTKQLDEIQKKDG